MTLQIIPDQIPHRLRMPEKVNTRHSNGPLFDLSVVTQQLARVIKFESMASACVASERPPERSIEQTTDGCLIVEISTISENARRLFCKICLFGIFVV